MVIEAYLFLTNQLQTNYEYNYSRFHRNVMYEPDDLDPDDLDNVPLSVQLMENCETIVSTEPVPVVTPVEMVEPAPVADVIIHSVKPVTVRSRKRRSQTRFSPRKRVKPVARNPDPAPTVDENGEPVGKNSDIDLTIIKLESTDVIELESSGTFEPPADIIETDINQTDINQTDIIQTDIIPTEIIQTEIIQTDIMQTDIIPEDLDIPDLLEEPELIENGRDLLVANEPVENGFDHPVENGITGFDTFENQLFDSLTDYFVISPDKLRHTSNQSVLPEISQTPEIPEPPEVLKSAPISNIMIQARPVPVNTITVVPVKVVVAPPDVELKKLYTCTFCTNHFTDIDVLQKHIRAVHHTCRVCGIAFNNSVKLLRHKETVHDRLKYYFCTECQFSSYSTESLHLHMRLHKNQKTFQCAKCTTNFSRKHLLNRHLLHTAACQPDTV